MYSGAAEEDASDDAQISQVREKFGKETGEDR